MKAYEVVKLKGNKLELSEQCMRVLEVSDGSILLLEMDRNEKEMIISSIGEPDSKIVEMKAIMENTPLSNAKIDLVLGEENISIVYGEGQSVKGSYYSVKLLDLKDSNISESELSNKLKGTGVVRELELVRL
ncbi:MAG TPA: hypothetical protein PK718_04565 [Candidatus Methanofastidiosa archaeon]|nr:hypothetical protein [Candidatus Methanofastidiosa archaeon]